MQNWRKLDLRIAVENALYEHTSDNTTLNDINEIRELFNSILDDFTEENNITK